MALSSAGKVKGYYVTPMLNCSFSVLGISPMTLGAVVLNCFSNITILKIVTAWLICAHVVGICFAISARLFVPLNKLCPTMQKCYRYSKIILNSNQFFITLTIKNGDDLGERFNHLMSNFKTMQKARRDWLNRGTGHNELCKAHGIIYAVEITNRGRGWHPHIHMVALVDDWIDGKKLSQQWEAITGDSKIVDVRRLKPSKGQKMIIWRLLLKCLNTL